MMSASSSSLPKCVIFPSRKRHTATVFFLHGLGDTAKNIAWVLNDLTQHSDLEHVKFVLPTAPVMPITGMNGRRIPSWFDCYSFDHANRIEDDEGLYRSAGWLNELITKEETENSIPSDRIVIGGLSQGGSIAILTALTTERPLAGLYSLSSYVPLRSTVPEIATPFAKKLPILWCHGKEDRQVDYDVWKGLAKTLADQLSMPFLTTESPTRLTRKELEEKDAVGLQFHSYAGLEHWINHTELEDLGVWISVRVPDV